MRFLASSIGVTCAAALALPLGLPAAATVARPAPNAEVFVPGGTQSLPLAPLSRDRVLGATAEQGLPARDVRHFSLVGVVWDDPDSALHGSVQVRTRAVTSGAWSGWQDIETHYGDDGADPDTAERTSGRVRGATAPLWVGDSDGVEVRVRADAEQRAVPGGALPSGMRLELVDPGEPAAPGSPPAGSQRAGALGTESVTGSAANAANAANAASAANAGLAPLGALEIPALDRARTERELLALRAGELTRQQRVKPYIGPRPGIVTRRGWGADEGLREKKFVYTKKVKAAFVHHTVTGNSYKCSQAPSVIRGIYRYHVQSMGWRDIGYNFLVDKCGKIYEGRAGGVAKPVLGAHTLGFNTNSMGIAVLGSFGTRRPAAAAVDAVARLAAWKLGLFGANPRGKTYLKSGGGNLYQKGKNVRLNVISGHRDGFSTACPGAKLYGKLGSARKSAATLQGR
ncbi:peptidoglycan recognition protein [Streptomyces sp. S3(2020)]|uniref:peptidoglycan recognition protein family protein n=1 Tax=Streptomyces sp. S3(2020) TaxID=2732044 RepID=UPI001488DDD6|nr:peptidoglycan recognition protein [Streptomyces sp. S3(2020)]NNN38144.1 peptidoglycan recognition protein [Streptomyces sp. S3(2020)]